MTYKEMRKEYRIKLKIRFEIDKGIFFLLPTIIWQPWKYRYNDSYVICFHWLVFAVGFGLWERR